MIYILGETNRNCLLGSNIYNKSMTSKIKLFQIKGRLQEFKIHKKKSIQPDPVSPTLSHQLLVFFFRGKIYSVLRNSNLGGIHVYKRTKNLNALKGTRYSEDFLLNYILPN